MLSIWKCHPSKFNKDEKKEIEMSSDDNFEQLVKAVAARFLHCKFNDGDGLLPTVKFM